MTDVEHRNETKGGCPVVHFDVNAPRPINGYLEEFDELREKAPIMWNEYANGFWMLLDDETVREALHDDEVFTSDSTVVTEPDPEFLWIPTMTKGKEHKLYRRILNHLVSPKAVRALEPRIRKHAVDFIEGFKRDGEVDFVKEFAMAFPTKVFLELLDLPHSDSDWLMERVEAVFAGLGSHGDEATAEGMKWGMEEIRQYFEQKLRERQADPSIDDFCGSLAKAKIGDRPITDDEFLNITRLLVLAGLDTVKSQLGYTLNHLATHPEHRRELEAKPELWPTAVEDMIRTYSIVMVGRKIGKDTEFHGCPMKEGDMVMLAVPSATRDEKAYDNGKQVVLDRGVNSHVAFAGGPHKCLGLHLARREITIAMEEWHARIPDYEVVGTDGLRETGLQLGLDELIVRWDVDQVRDVVAEVTA